MKARYVSAGLLVLLIIALGCAGCTTQPAAAQTGNAGQGTPVPSAPQSAAASAAATATVAPATTTCPEINGLGILQGSWDTRAVGISNGIDESVNDHGWDGVLWAPKLVLTQKCWDITGTYQDVDGTGPVSAVMKKDPVTGRFVATGTWANHADATNPSSSSGRFTIIMAANNQSFEGYLLTIPPDSPDYGSYPENWEGKRT
jgi:hypothetical protein